MGDGHDDKKLAEDDVRSALVPVSTPHPKPRAPKPGAPVDTDRAPTVDGILDPERPSLEGATSSVILDSIPGLVEAIYNDVLLHALIDLKPQLAEVPKPPGDTDFIAKLLGWSVEVIATATLTELGGLAAKKLLGGAGGGAETAADSSAPTQADAAASTPAESHEAASSTASKAADAAVSGASKAGGKAAGDWTQARLKAAPGEHSVSLPAGMKLVDQFVEMERLQLVARREDAVTMLRVIRASADRQRPGELAALDASLRGLIADGALGNWFRHKVTMEWLNFLARLSLGPRPEGQATNMPGANTIGGIHETGTRGLVQWHGSHEGFVEVTIEAESGAALSLITAVVSGRPGAAAVLQSLSDEHDAAGNRYSLATMPAFRRIWLKTGDARFDTTPAFVITPEGALEVNYDDPKLATLGGGDPGPYAGPYDSFEGDQRRDSTAWMERANRSAQAMAGVQRVVTLLASKSLEVLR